MFNKMSIIFYKNLKIFYLIMIAVYYIMYVGIIFGLQ